MNRSTHQQPACLVTGATGFIGRRLCERWDTDTGRVYRPLVRSQRDAQAYRAHGRVPVVADLRQHRRLAEVLHGVETVVHLAYGDAAVEATTHLVNASIAHGVKRFVHISTMAVHGPAPGPEAARESSARIGRYGHPYPDTKAAIEEVVQHAHDDGGLPAVILRPTIVYGPRSHFVRHVVEEARSGRVLRFDRGTGVCNAVYVDDVCDAIDAALVTPEAVGEAMFINADYPVTWGDFVGAFATLVQPEPEWVEVSSAEVLAWWAAHPPATPRGGLHRIWRRLVRRTGRHSPPPLWPEEGRVLRETFPVAFQNEKAKHLLGWVPRTDFTTGVGLTHQWLIQEGLVP